MNTLLICIVLCAFLVLGSTALPVDDSALALEDVDTGVEYDLKSELMTAEEGPSRQKRATCDLISFMNINHSACAGHCLLKKYKGGYCNNKGVCVCRK